MRRRLGLAAPALLVLAPVLAGCGLAGGGTVGTGEGFSVESALGALPDVVGAKDGASGDSLRVVVGDLGTVRGSTRSAKGVDLAQWVRPLDRAGVSTLLPDDLHAERSGNGRVRDVLGFDARDVVSYASIEDPASSLTVVSLADGEALKDGVQDTGGGDIGDVVRSSGAVPPVFPVVLGTATRGGQVALAQSAEVLLDWADKGATLADDDDLSAVAKALDGKDVVAAELVDGPVRPRPATVASRTPSEPVPGYDALGVGQQVTDGEVTTWVAYAADDPDALASVVRRQWRDGSSVVSGEPLSELARLDAVATDGDVVLVGLTPRAPDTVLRMLQRADTPFVVAPSEKD